MWSKTKLVRRPVRLKSLICITTSIILQFFISHLSSVFKLLKHVAHFHCRLKCAPVILFISISTDALFSD